MFQFTYKLKIAERIKAKCDRHPATIRSGMEEAASRADVPPCFTLLDLHHARLTLEAAHRDSVRKAAPWAQVRLKRAKPPVDEHHEP